MLALEIEKSSPRFAPIITDPVNAGLLETLTRYARLLRVWGHEVRVYSESSLLKLNELPSEKKEQIRSYYENACEWIAPTEPLLPPGVEREKVFLRRALAFYDLEISDDFLSTLEPGQIVEVYGDDMVQLYRSSNFYQITGYSLLDISVYEWFVLWERPGIVLEKAMHYTKSMILGYIPVKRLEIPSHVIREIHNSHLTSEFEPRAAVAEFLFMGTVTSRKAPGQPRGFVCTSRGQLIAVGNEALTIAVV
jgi:hypothetical protein